jgi:hypothetical protein
MTLVSMVSKGTATRCGRPRRDLPGKIEEDTRQATGMGLEAGLLPGHEQVEEELRVGLDRRPSTRGLDRPRVRLPGLSKGWQVRVVEPVLVSWVPGLMVGRSRIAHEPSAWR